MKRLGRLLRVLACAVDEHRPENETDTVTLCRTCGVVLCSKVALRDKIDKAINQIWRDCLEKR